IWLTRSKVLGILVAVFVGGSLLYQIAGMVFQLVPALSNVPNYLLTGCLHSLAEATGIAGPLGIPHVLGVATAYLVVLAVASAVVLKKKDV
ncbi:MAG: ABC transporter permease, partial [Raoultibacter sp.]